jgi:hypothetical protein
MKAKAMASAVMLFLCASLTAFSARGAVLKCHAADGRSAATISALQSLATSTVPADIALRDSLHLTIRRATDVSLITTETTCQRAATELDKLWQTGTTNRQVYVYKVGQDFGVEDPQAGSGDYRSVAFFTSKWVYKSLLVGP